jgi:hypothetical protein
VFENLDELRDELLVPALLGSVHEKGAAEAGVH